MTAAWIVVALLVGYLAGRIGSWRNLEDWVSDRFPDDADDRPWWQQPFLLFALWVFHPMQVTRHTVRHFRGLPMVEPPERLPAPEINQRWAGGEDR